MAFRNIVKSVFKYRVS